MLVDPHDAALWSRWRRHRDVIAEEDAAADSAAAPEDHVLSYAEILEFAREREAEDRRQIRIDTGE